MDSDKIGHVTKVSGDSLEVQLERDVLGVKRTGATNRAGQLGTYITVPLIRGKVLGFVVGMARAQSDGAADQAPIAIEAQLVGTIEGRRFSCGIDEYPIIGDEVLAAGKSDFEIVFATSKHSSDKEAHQRSFVLGRFAMDRDFEVSILGKEFFSKHAAILGNSGSGKSCCTALILQEISRLRASQVVLFDLHGEYRAAFSNDDGQLQPHVVHLGRNDLILPYWLLGYEELEQLFVDFSNPQYVDNQTSFLRMAMQKLKGDTAAKMGLETEFTVDTPIYFDLEQLRTYAENLNDARFITNTDRYAFVNAALRSRSREEQERVMLTRRVEFHQGEPEGETVHQLYHGKLVGLVNRIETRLRDRRYDFVLKPIQHAEHSPYFREALSDLHSPAELSAVVDHVLNLLMGRGQTRTNLTIVDLSGVPFDMVDICVALVTHLLFEFNFWTPAEIRHPTLLVYEEAHNYIPREARGKSFARSAVERVAREGRKYGVSAMVVSQRPSELSETVLSQCNNMIILRMNNPDDQQYVAKVVSDQFANLVRVLPMLRPGEGFAIGDSVLMPMRTLIHLPEHIPQSSDFDFFKCWSADRAGNFTHKVVNSWWRQDRRAFDETPAAE